MRARVGCGGKALIGADLCKSPEVLLPAYDDSAGVTARFNLNLLTRINRELGANFQLQHFAHAARWNESEAAVEMHLVSQCTQTVTIGERNFQFATGESIHTESSRKYEIADFTHMAKRTGWRVEHVWSDGGKRFAIIGMTAQ
jgi:uncharacterized SAM-dependent methyltransferase